MRGTDVRLMFAIWDPAGEYVRLGRKGEGIREDKLTRKERDYIGR